MVNRIFLVAILAFSLSMAEEPTSSPLEVTARVNHTEVTVGDVVHYEIVVTYPAEGRVDLPAVRGNVGHFEVQDARVTQGQAPDGRLTATYSLFLASFTLGNDTLPSQRVEYRAGTNGSLDTNPLVLYTPPTFVNVRRVSSIHSELADISPPEKLPGTIPWGLVALLAAGTALGLYGVWRKKHPRKISAAAQPPLPPYEAALQSLRVLEQASLPSQGLGREFAFTLSEIMRSYIGARYEIDALEATTEELLQRAVSLPLAPEQQAWLKSFTADLDTVKFATGALAEAEGARQIEATREFLHATKPVVDPGVAT